jgi:hypothetical protein
MDSRTRILVCCGIAGVLLAMPTFGGAIPYPNDGAIVPPSLTTAPANGSLVAYFYGSSAAHTDEVAVKDVTAGWTSPWFFSNHSTAVGDSFTVGNVTAGDVLEFLLWDMSTGNTYSSNPLDSPDGINHFYLTPKTTVGPAGIPTGTYVGGEDLSLAVSDLDYNDTQFVYRIAAAPEPTTFLLVGLGLVAASLHRRVRSKQ